ncbi:hypothetical protein GCM10009557_87740 [Virgisporangium ochraceum]|uniref:Nucleoside phosphorylase domain-containing protein n=1 Tax=Virgisporangium ochraceum TaxID=65505 RepID=A0A8J3ZUS7_9ACTN|nr:RIP homotypic interaction motif-containing protein [Virgisporangium ochraceum]GIJ70577.1 hypothetical protein Voc01_054940 [Virgisporangium ochraceum]
MTDQVDVVVVTALLEEFEAARDAALTVGVDGWEERGAGTSLPYLLGGYRTRNGGRLSVALTRPTYMGGRESSPVTAMLTDRLKPACVAMCGVCAGNPGETVLGDVVVADPVYEWDEGKWSDKHGFRGDHRQHRLDQVLVRAAQELDRTVLPSYGDATAEDSLYWLLERVHAGQDPKSHRARARYFPPGEWASRLNRFEADGMIARRPDGTVELTAAGSALIQRRLFDDVDGPRHLPFRVLVAPMASGSAVVAHPGIWPALESMGQRKIAALEMEAATIATVAHGAGVPYWLAVKGVMDHADGDKDDRFKAFAARASAEVLFSLLDRVVVNEASRGNAAGTASGSRYVITLDNARGVQIGDHNVQTNTF